MMYQGNSDDLIQSVGEADSKSSDTEEVIKKESIDDPIVITPDNEFEESKDN